MEQHGKIFLCIVGICILLIGSYFYFFKGKPKNMVEIGGLYDAQGYLIKKGLSVIGGVEGVKYITLKINVENRDTVPLTLFVKDMTPQEILSAKPTDSITVQPSKIGSWITGAIDVEAYEGTVQSFCVTVESEAILTLRESNEVSGCLDVQVDPNPVANFDVSLDSQVGEGSINPGCEENWQCTEWSSCSNSLQTRTCSDQNACGTEVNKPSEQQACQISFQTNAVEGNYKQSGVWINWGAGIYYAGGISSFSCTSLSATGIVTTTPEGYNICTRTGYDITERVYLDDGFYGIIFKP